MVVDRRGRLHEGSRVGGAADVPQPGLLYAGMHGLAVHDGVGQEGGFSVQREDEEGFARVEILEIGQIPDGRPVVPGPVDNEPVEPPLPQTVANPVDPRFVFLDRERQVHPLPARFPVIGDAPPSHKAISPRAS